MSKCSRSRYAPDSPPGRSSRKQNGLCSSPSNCSWIRWLQQEMCSQTPMLQGSGMQPRKRLSPTRSSKQKGWPPCSCSGCRLYSGCQPGSGSPLRSSSQTRPVCPPQPRRQVFPRCSGSSLHRSAPLLPSPPRSCSGCLPCSGCQLGSGSPLRSGSQTRPVCPSQPRRQVFPRCSGSSLHRSAPLLPSPPRQLQYRCSSALRRTIPYSHRANSPRTPPPAPPDWMCRQYWSRQAQPLPPLFPRR